LTAALKKNGLDVDALLQRSRIYLGSGKHAEAQKDLNQVLHFRNDSAEAHYLLSKVGQAREDTAFQKQELGQVLRVDPKNLAARVELARLLLANRGSQSALQLLDEAPPDQKGTIPVVVQRNWALLALGQTAEARKGIDQALSAGKVPEALLQDAALKLEQKDYAGARASAEGALTQSPEDVRALNVLVQSYALQNQLPAGLQKVREHALRQPTAAPVQQFLGQLLASSGDRAGARKAFEAANAAKPGLVTAELALAELDTTEGKRDEARKRISAVVSSHPGNINGRLLFAQLEMTEGKSAAAIEQYRKVVALDEKNAVALNGLAYLLAESKQPDEALKYAQKAKELAPDNPAVDDTLGWTYFQKGMYSLAVTHLEIATAKEGTARRRYHLAMAYLKAGDPKRGRQTFDAAYKMDPNLPEAQVARQVLGIAPN
jgi:tetratricopeptide (TPR) repeat protein